MISLTSMLLAIALVEPAAASSSSIAVAPVHVVGAAPSSISAARIDEAIASGLERGESTIEHLAGDCEERDCWIELAKGREQRFVLLSEVEQEGPDLEVRLEVVDVESGQSVASTEGLCEICGEDEIFASTADVAAQLIPRLERLEPEPARIVLEGQPRGATVEIDGQVVGALPWEGEVEPGEHELVISSEGYVSLRRTIVANAGVQEVTGLQLMETIDDGRASRRLVGAGAGLISAGVVGVGLGAGLFALDGRPYRRGCDPADVDVNGRCPQMYEATAPAVVAVVVGGAALATGVVLLVRGLRRGRRTPPANAVLMPTPRGLALRF